MLLQRYYWVVVDVPENVVVMVLRDLCVSNAISAEARRGIGSDGLPTTSAGYSSVDGGFVREQIYSLIRQLDVGALTARDFRVKVAQLGECLHLFVVMLGSHTHAWMLCMCLHACAPV